MRVAVLGSFREDDRLKWALRDSTVAFRAACRRVGSEVIARGHSLILGSDSVHTADGNALQGACEVLRPTASSFETPRIMMIRNASSSSSNTGTLSALHRSMPGMIVEYPVDGTWAVVKLVQTQLADALILIGGAEKTEHAGLTAALGHKPLACIGSFGGAAYALNHRFYQSPTTWNYRPEQTEGLLRLQVPFSENVLKVALDTAWIEGAPKLMIIHGRSTDRDKLKEYLLRYVGRVIVLTDEFDPMSPIPDKFERFASSVDGAIALLTPDDLGRLAHAEAIEARRARENVWVEVGWFWGHRGRKKLLLLRKGDVSIPSDLGNVEHYPYDRCPLECEERIQRFIRKLRSASEARE